MIEKKIIPAVLSSNEKVIKESFALFDGVAEWLQLDVADGQFVSNITCRPHLFANILKQSQLELHLMVANPLAWLSESVEVKAKRVYLHLETNFSLETIESFKQKGIEVFLALNPETSLEVFLPYKYFVNGALFLGVNPGKQGQEFIISTLEKITEFKKLFPDKIAVVDGGVNQNNIKQLSVAGADWFVCGSAIMASAKPIEQYRRLNELL